MLCGRRGQKRTKSSFISPHSLARFIAAILVSGAVLAPAFLFVHMVLCTGPAAVGSGWALRQRRAHLSHAHRSALSIDCRSFFGKGLPHSQ